MKIVRPISPFIFAVLILQSCGNSGGSGGADLPLLTPPVKASTPTAYHGTAARKSLDNLLFIEADFHAMSGTIDPTDFKTRFFEAGPTDVFSILQAIDDRLTGLNGASTTGNCLTQTPVAFNLTFVGASIPMWAQCYQMVGTNGFVQWGVKDSTTYLWVQVGAGDLAATVESAPNSSTGKIVHVWGTVGNAGQYNSNGTTSANWDSIGSYGIMELEANSSTGSLEMTAAGTGLGYCGMQFKSDGTNILAAGSIDMGATCDTDATKCVLASDATTTAPSCSLTTADFTLTPIGRQAATGGGATSYGASNYPGGAGGGTNSVVLNGTSTDSLAIGPNVPTTGVGQF